MFTFALTIHLANNELISLQQLLLKTNLVLCMMVGLFVCQLSSTKDMIPDRGFKAELLFPATLQGVADFSMNGWQLETSAAYMK